MSEVLIYPMSAHVAITCLLYVMLTIARAPAVWNIGARKDGRNPCASIEPRISANLSNQFEWPLFFYTICLILMMKGQGADAVYLGLAWLFVFGRIIHSVVQIGTTNIRLRGIIFSISFVAVIGMWIKLIVGLSD